MTPHFRIVYPPGTQRGVKRTSRFALVYMTVGDVTIKLPGLTAISFDSRVDDADRVRLEFVGTTEIVYDGPEISTPEEGPRLVIEDVQG